jgi:hypothetical protein
MFLAIVVIDLARYHTSYGVPVDGPGTIPRIAVEETISIIRLIRNDARCPIPGNLRRAVVTMIVAVAVISLIDNHTRFRVTFDFRRTAFPMEWAEVPAARPLLTSDYPGSWIPIDPCRAIDAIIAAVT